jgi:hypothetical protein
LPAEISEIVGVVGKMPPLSGSFQPDARLADSNDLKTFLMDCDVMVIPAECHQVFGVRGAAPVPGLGVMHLEPVVRGAAVHRATHVPSEDMTSELPAHGSRTATQTERCAVFGDSNHVDDTVAEDLFESAATDPGAVEDGDPGLPSISRCRTGVHGDDDLGRR